MRIKVYSDGAVYPNPGRGGIGVVILSSETVELSEGYRLSTNNRMELLAAIRGLEYFKTRQKIELFSDSQYLVNGINHWVSGWIEKDWQRKTPSGFVEVKNRDLWERLIELKEKHSVYFKWIRGHNGDKWNERSDELAQKALLNDELLCDDEYEKYTPLSKELKQY